MSGKRANLVVAVNAKDDDESGPEVSGFRVQSSVFGVQDVFAET
jgi:hypothetical protein